MQTFRDAEGRQWQLRLDLSVAKRLRDAGYDLLDEERLGQIAQDIYEIVNTLYLICRRQADELGMGDESFGQMLTTCYEPAKDAFLEELRLFYMGLGLKAQARIVEAVVEGMKKIEGVIDRQLTTTRLSEMIDRKLAEAEHSIDADLAAQFGEPSLNSRG